MAVGCRTQNSVQLVNGKHGRRGIIDYFRERFDSYVDDNRVAASQALAVNSDDLGVIVAQVAHPKRQVQRDKHVSQLILARDAARVTVEMPLA